MGSNRQINKLMRLSKQHAKGKISYDELVKRERPVLAKLDKTCKHQPDASGEACDVCGAPF